MATNPNDNPSEIPSQPQDQQQVPEPAAKPASPKKRRRGRRILTVLAVLFVMLVGLVIALPYLASTAWATQKIVGTVNGQIGGELALDQLSLAWFGPCKLSGIRVSDPSNREVVVADSIAVQGGVWGLVKKMGLPEEIQIQAPKVTLYVTESGGVSLADAFASGKPAEPSPEKSKAELPDLRVVVEDGQVTVVQRDGKVTETVNVSADARLASAGDVTAKLDAQMASGGKLTGDVGMKNLITGGKFDVSKASGSVKLKTDQPLQIKPVAEAFTASPLEGQVALDISGEIVSGGFKGKVQTDLTGVRAVGEGQQGLEPIDVAVRGDVSYTTERLEGALDLEGGAGTANVKFGFDPASTGSMTPGDEIATKILAGESFTLPTIEADVQGQIDLAALAKMLGGLLPLKEGTTVNSGSMMIHDLKLRGGAEPSLTGRVEVSSVSATSPSGPIDIAPIEAKVEITSSAGAGVSVRATQLKSDFATIDVEGTPQEMIATITGDLDRLQQNLSQVVDLGESQFAGQIDGRVTVKRNDDEAVDVNASIKGTNVRYGEREIAQLEVGGDLAYSPERIDGTVKLDGSPGTANVRFGYVQQESAPVTPADQIASVILSGGSPMLPQFEADVQGRLDLPAVARLLDEALPLKEGTSVTGGSLVIQDLKVRGGAEPSLTGVIELTGASATSPSGPINIAPIEAGAEVTSTTGSGVSIRATQLKSDFAQIDVEGTPQQMTATVAGDLDRLQQNLSQVVDMGASKFAGRFNGRFELKRSGDERVDVTAQLDAENLQITQPDGSLQFSRCSVRHDGHVELPEGKPPKIVSKQTQVDIDQAASVLASGSYDLNDSGFSAQVDLSRLDLGFVNRQATLLGVEGLSGIDGTLSAKTKLTGGAGGKLSGDGEWQVSKLVLDGKTVTDSINGRLSGLSLDPEASQFTVAQAKVESTIAKLDADSVSCTWGDALNLAGRIQLGAELAQAVPVLARISGWQDPPRMKGRVSINSNVKSEGEGFAATGTGNVDGFEMTTKDGTTLRDQFKFEWDAAVARSPEQIKVRKLSANSNMLTTSLSGQADDYSKTCRLDLSGDYKLDWAKVTDLIHTLSPPTKSTVALSGQPTGRVRATGALFGPDAGLALEELNAEAGTGWSSAAIYGVEMQNASFSPVMRRGVLTLPETAIKASGGTVRLGGQVDLQPETPVLRIPGQLQMLDKVKVSKQLGEELLGRINPLFVQMTEVEGQIDMRVQGLELPLGESITHGGGGGGVIDLRALKIQPGGFMANMLELGGLGSREKYGMKVGQLVFTVRDGRIWYDNLTVDFAGRYDLTFRGSVGFDDTLDLVVSMPVRAALLERLQVRGPVLEYAKKLEGTRVEAPLVGTRNNPNLDLSKVDTKKLLKDVIEKTAINDLLKGLQPPSEKKEPPPEKKPQRPRRIKRDN